ncbi:MAG: hypothetical protein AAGJ94_04610 [Pseudomonadota bacterium]
MSQQTQFTLEDLKKHPEYAAFIMALEERIQQRESRRRNVSLAILSVSIPILIAIAAGVYGLAQQTIENGFIGIKSELAAIVPETVSTRVREEIDGDFRQLIALQVSDEVLSEARNSYELAAALSQLNSVATAIDQGDSFSSTEAREALSAVEQVVERGALDDPLSRGATLAAGVKLAASFSSAYRSDFLVELTNFIGTDVALGSDEIALAVSVAVGRELIGTRNDSLAQSDMRNLFNAAALRLRRQPNRAREYEFGVLHKEYMASKDNAVRAKLVALITETAENTNKFQVGEALVHTLLLTERGLLISGGAENVTATDRRVSLVMQDFVKEYQSELKSLAHNSLSREAARSLLVRVYAIAKQEDELDSYISLVERACDTAPKLCDGDEDEYFKNLLSELGIIL